MIPEILQQNFLHPVGLAALLGLIPLIIFYLVRPKPEREVMPSMTFFSEEKQKGRIRNALQKLKRNKLLILHIFFILLAAAAIANPLVRGLETDGDSVIILDTSASMNDNQRQAKNFAYKHLGSQNTVIAVGEESRIVARDASTEAARQAIREQENTVSSTDLISALQLASNYPGKIVLASDNAHNAAGDLRTTLEDISSSRNIKVMDLNHENSHAFTDIKFKDGKTLVTVQNFINRNRTLEITNEGPDSVKEVNVPALSTKTVEYDLEPGKHQLVLPPDELAIDNNMHISMPKDESIEVRVLGGESSYFKTAINLINETEYSNTDSIGDADVYFVSKDFELSENNLNQLEQEVENDKAVIIEDRADLPGFAPVENRSRSSTRTVQVTAASITTSFSSSVTDYSVKGNSLSTPEEALVLSEDSRVLLYNVDDETFGQKITYPIFWKNILLRMSDTKTAKELNIETGRQMNFEHKVTHKGKTISGTHTVQDTGYYSGQQIFAVNLLNPEESRPQTSETTEGSDIDSKPGRNPAGKYLTSLLAIVATLELIYLSRGGAI